RGRRLAAWAKNIAVFDRTVVAGGAGELLRPDNSSGINVDREQLVGHGRHQSQLFRSGPRCYAIRDERGVQIRHDARLAVELNLPQQLDVLRCCGTDELLVFLPVSTLAVAAVSQPVRTPAHNTA